MTYPKRKNMAVLMAFVAFCSTVYFCSRQANAISRLNYIETHVHLKGDYRRGGAIVTDWDAAARTCLSSMRALGIQKCFLMPPPFAPDKWNMYDWKVLESVCNKYPEKLSFLAGGGTLNPIIQEAYQRGKVSNYLVKKFDSEAIKIVRSKAVGFGEMTCLHLSFRRGHSFEEAPPNHPLYLRLADIAALNHMPIDIHMEAVEHKTHLPSGFRSPPNPQKLKKNISCFEQLLSHNRKAKIVWAHAGWDNTGEGDVNLLRRLLTENSNLYLSLKSHFHSKNENNPLTQNKVLKNEWLELIRDFPTRFILGSDQFYGIPGKTIEFPNSEEASRLILNQLDYKTACRVASENAKHIYRFK